MTTTSTVRFNTVFLLFVCIYSTSGAISFRVSESAPVGHSLGWTDGAPSTSTQNRFLVVYPDEATEQAIRVDERTGEVTVAGPLDYEASKRYEVLAVPSDGGDGVEVVVEVEDENDNAPTFPDDVVRLEMSEFARLGAEFPLPSAIDPDSPPFDVQKYRIAQGNVNNVFKLSTRRLNDMMYVDVVVNGQLDREYRDQYELIIEAVDGGDRVGRLRVSVVVLDANDNAPIFSQQRYTFTVPSNASTGDILGKVSATDADSGANGHVSYRLAEPSSFRLSSDGVLSSSSPLLPASHQLVVVAADSGEPPLESTAFVTLIVQASDHPHPSVDVVWLTASGEPALSEDALLGSVVARVGLENAQDDRRLSLSGCPSLCMRQSDSPRVYLITVCGPLDRETTAEFHLQFALNRGETVEMEHPVVMKVVDVNDHSPSWPSPSIHISLSRSRPDSPDANLAATDPDEGKNAELTYEVEGTDWVAIDKHTGRIRIAKEQACPPSPIRFKVIARDGGTPSRQGELSVEADAVEPEQPPLFSKPLYHAALPEDAERGTCVVQVSASSGQCGGERRIRYSWQDPAASKMFSVDDRSGTVCLEGQLDYEHAKRHQYTVIAHDQGGSTASAVVSISVGDVNDHAPVFRPAEFNWTVREGAAGPLLRVRATDQDEGLLGQVSYSLHPSSPSFFRVNESSGEVSSIGPLKRGDHRVTVTARDAQGLPADYPAIISLSVLPPEVAAPQFTLSSYLIETSEDMLPGIAIGGVDASGEEEIVYSIFSGDSDHQFSIQHETGRISVARYLDAEKNDAVLLNVQARFASGAANQTQVLIRIADRNDNPPVFEATEQTATVREDHPVDTPFHAVMARDDDGKQNGLVSYQLLSSHPPCPLLVHPLTGQISLTATLDYEKIHEFRIRIRAVDGGVPPRSANTSVVLKVVDVNDNAPVFEKETYAAEVAEHCAPMTRIVTVRAVDSDSAQNGRVGYRIADSHSPFAVDAMSGEVFVKSDLDRELQSQYNVTVEAFDHGTPSLNNSVLLMVTVSDINDHAPECPPALSVSVGADADQRLPVYALAASDPDDGANGTLTYRSQQANPLFLVKPSGEVYLRKAAKEYAEKEYRLAIVASDGGAPNKSSVCQISVAFSPAVSDVRISQPVLRSVRVPDNCDEGCPLLKVNATGVDRWSVQQTDGSALFSIAAGVLSVKGPLPTVRHVAIGMADAGGRMRTITIKVLPSRPLSSLGARQVVRVSSTLPVGAKVATLGDAKTQRDGVYWTVVNETSVLEVDEQTGAVLVASRLGPLAAQSIDLLVKRSGWHGAVGAGAGDIIKVLTVDVEPAVVEMPRWPSIYTHTNVSEGAATGTVVYTFAASVADSDASLTYRMVEDDGVFVLDPVSGELTLQRTLEWSESPSHIVIVEALNEGASARAVLEVAVDDVNNHSPQIVSSPLCRVYPGIGSDPLHYVVARDADGGAAGTVSYSVIQGNDDGAISMDVSSGALTLQKRLESSRRVTVRAQDGGEPRLFADQEITIEVGSGPSRWTLFASPLYKVTVEQAAANGTRLLDFPPSNGVRFRLLPSTGVPFSIDVSTGRITVAGHIGEERYRFIVLAESESDSDWCSVLVRSPPASPPPLRISSASCQPASVPENTAVPALRRVLASGDKNTFAITAGNERGLFHIDQSTGVVSCSELDREEKEEHLVVIQVNDGGERTDTCTVRVRVLDVNDNAPKFGELPTLLTLNEGWRRGHTVFNLTVTDPDADENGLVRIDLLEDASGLFDINEYNQLYLARSHSPPQGEWMIRIVAEDQARNATKRTERFIRVVDKRSEFGRDEKPEFLKQHYWGSVDEGMARGQMVAKLATSSRDSRLTYSIVDGNSDGAFRVDSMGVVATAEELDAEVASLYTLRVTATGQGTDTATTLTVTVRNLNDNPPSFPPVRQRKLSEALPAGSFVASVTANDVDEGSRLEYSLDPPDSRFHIDTYSGAIHSTATLDREEADIIELGIKVSDGVHSAKTSLRIVLLDENDNTPEFSHALYDLIVPPNLPIDGVIGEVLASDPDEEENARITYSIEGRGAPIRIDPVTGSLTAASSMSGEVVVTVWAVDGGIPPRRESAAVRVRVGEKEQTAKGRPRFTQPHYEFTVSESMPAHQPFANVSVSPSALVYRILDTAAARAFRVDHYGLLSARIALDRETQENYRFQVDVAVGWSGVSSSNSSTWVEVRVTDANDNSPLFGEPPTIVVGDTMRSGDVLGRVSASDGDEGERGRVEYRILAGDDHRMMKVDAQTGAVALVRWSDEQLTSSGDSWKLLVEARDGGVRPRRQLQQVSVRVDVASLSAAAPFFLLPVYTRHVSETAPVDQPIFKVRAVTALGRPPPGLLYSLADETHFSLDSSSGQLWLREPLDYETQSIHRLSVSASDSRGRKAVSVVEVRVLPVDEHPPVFQNTTYTMQIPLWTEVGTRIGSVRAADADAGADGEVRFRLEGGQGMVGIDPLSGQVVLREKVPSHKNLTIEQLVVIAESGPSQQARATLYLEIGEFPSRALPSSSSTVQVAGMLGAASLLLLLLLLCCCVWRHRENSVKEVDSPRKQVFSVRGQTAAMALDRDSPPMRIGVKSQSSHSSLSAARAHSHPDSGIDPDALSIGSSASDYLQALGVRVPAPLPRARRNGKEEMIYARVEDLAPGPLNHIRGHGIFESPVQLAQACHRVSPPTFQPITELFSEIERLQKDRPREYVQIEI